MIVTMETEVRDLVQLGVLLVEGVRVEASSPAFWEHAAAFLNDLERTRGGQKPSEIAELQDVRALYRATGLDPTKNRPSCEALLRRVINGKGLYQINNAVDTLNLWSLRLMVPACVHNADALVGDVRLRLGRAGERYLGIDGKKDVNLADLLVLADALGPFGNPSADSDRTKVTPETSAILLVLYIPRGRPEAWSRRALAETAEDFVRWCGGAVVYRALAPYED